MKPQTVRLFIKPGCHWCAEAQEGLRVRGISPTILDVTSDRAAWEEMKNLTGQTSAPCLDVDGHILADFGAHELDVWWLQMGFDDEKSPTAVVVPPKINRSPQA
jgi:monothiol glutaredoxin